MDGCRKVIQKFFNRDFLQKYRQGTILELFKSTFWNDFQDFSQESFRFFLHVFCLRIPFQIPAEGSSGFLLTFLQDSSRNSFWKIFQYVNQSLTVRVLQQDFSLSPKATPISTENFQRISATVPTGVIPGISTKVLPRIFTVSFRDSSGVASEMSLCVFQNFSPFSQVSFGASYRVTLGIIQKLLSIFLRVDFQRIFHTFHSCIPDFLL